MQDKKVLLIDADPQGDLTTCLGWHDTDSLQITTASKLSDIIREENADPYNTVFVGLRYVFSPFKLIWNSGS